MRIRAALLFPVLLTLLAPAALAGDLLSIYREAQIQDAQFAAAKAQYIAAQERLPQGRALLLPNVSLDAGANWNQIDIEYDSGTFPSGKRDYRSHNYGVTVVQPLYRRQNSLIFEQAKTQLKQAESQLSLAAQDLIVRVAQGYFDILLARANLATILSQKTAVAEQLEQAKRNFIVGTATITDQREAQARYDLVLAQEIGARNQLEVARRALEILLGRQVEEPLAGLFLPITLSRPEPADMRAWVDQAFETSLEVRLARESLELAMQDVERARAGHLPTLDAVGSLSQNYQGSSGFGVGSDTRAAVIGLQLNVPLYQGGAINSRTREAAAGQERARQELESARRVVGQRTREAFLGVTSGLAQISALEQAVSSTQLQLEATKLGQEVGVRTAVDVLNAEQQLSLAQRDLYQAIFSTILSQLQLKAAVGTLTETDLADVNALLRAGG
jgi:outer membrane protein